MATLLAPRGLVRAALFVLVALLGPTLSAAQELRAPPKPLRARLAPAYGRAGAPHMLGHATVGTVTESEPNDSIPDADAVALGDTASGVVDPAGDVDFFGFDLTAGTIVQLDVDASQFGSALDPILGLFDAVSQLAFSDDRDGLDSRIEFTIPTTGRYYAGIADYYAGGGAEFFYTLKIVIFVPPPPGPGDTTRLFAQGLSFPLGMSAAENGDLFVTDLDASRVARVNAAGTVTTFVSPQSDVQDVVIDGYGDLLVAAGESGVWRVSPEGVLSRFTSEFASYAITVGPDGDVWVGGGTTSAIEIRRYDSRGAPKATIDVTAMGGLSDIAFSPAGELYASNGFDGVFGVTIGGPIPMISAPPYLEGLAFDEDGYLYVANGYLGEVHLFDPAFQPIYRPFARTNLGGPIHLVFGRDAVGAMTSRLFAANGGYNLSLPFAGGIVEMNPAGMRAPGFRVGIDLLRVATTSLRPGIVGTAYADTLRLANPPGPVTWSILTGILPAGVTLGTTTGVLSGTPEASGNFSFSVRGTSGGEFGVAALALVIGPQVPLTDVANAFLGQSGAVTGDMERYLDLQGNDNGRLDVADFREYLRSISQLAGAAGRTKP